MELKSLKLLELKALAKSKGIHDAYKYKKDELILKLNEIEANEPSEEDKEKIKDSESLEEGAEPEQTAELPDKIVEEIESSGTESSVYCLMRHVHHLTLRFFLIILL
jgi:hypothetical protein